MGVLNGSGSSASPSVAVTGASPATIYYAKVFSVNGADKDSSNVKVFCTKSLSSGSIKVYFNRTVDHSVSSGTNAFYNPAIGDSLAAYINRAKSTVDLTIYNWDDSAGGDKITTALNAAYARGIKIRLIYDGTVSSPPAGIISLNPAIKKVASPQGSGYTIMHNKFVIIDANRSNPNDAVVWTGATNWTKNQLGLDPNNVIIFQDQSMARGYKLEFDEMWGDSSITSSSNTALAKYGQYKKDNTPHEYNVNGKRVESYFSPSDGTNSHILSTIATANSDLYFAQLLITRNDLANKIASQITANSLTAKGIVNDTAGAGATPYFIMRTPMTSANLKINRFNNIFHHKYLIVDQSNSASDPLVLTGSHNWSNGADQKNDENTVIVHDATIANMYFQEFTQRFKDEITGIEAYEAHGTALVYPNPAKNEFSVKIDSKETTAAVTLTDVLGKQTVSTPQTSITNGVITLSDLDLPTGVYIVNVKAGETTYTSRIVIHQ